MSDYLRGHNNNNNYNNCYRYEDDDDDNSDAEVKKRAVVFLPPVSAWDQSDTEAGLFRSAPSHFHDFTADVFCSPALLTTVLL